MGQEKKYHITDEGVIYRVDDTGEITELGNVDSIDVTRSTSSGSRDTLIYPLLEMKHPKFCKWMWIALVSWIVLIVACITFFVQHESANDYISYCNDRIGCLYEAVFHLQSELDNKDPIQNGMPIRVIGVEFANINCNGRIIDNYGSTMYSDRVCYLQPKILYIGRETGTYRFDVKIIPPNETVLGDSLPSDYETYSFFVNTESDLVEQHEAPVYGWVNPGFYEPGIWMYEIWYDERLVYSTTIEIF